MIVRTAFRCLTCDQVHVVRIGVGHDARQTHRFPCRSCGEEMEVALVVDHDAPSSMPEAVENAEVAQETSDALVVNVHANYVVHGADRFSDRAFPHIFQMHAQFEAAREAGSTRPITPEDILTERPRPFRRPDFGDEWQMLKKAWSLQGRGRTDLARKEMARASDRFHFNEPLNDVADWIWRFFTFLNGTAYERILHDMMREIRPALRDGLLDGALAERARRSPERARRYFDVFRDYFSAWPEFSQVLFAVGKGLGPLEGHVATTSGFNSVRMFYGNAFEAFASSVDLLATMNNALDGRDWTSFRNVDLQTYLRSDKPKRFDCFADRPAFATLAGERDAGLRNASHHGKLRHDPATGLLSYRDGKGDTGEEVTLGYAEYLSRSSALFLQMVTLLRFELLICQVTRAPFPI